MHPRTLTQTVHNVPQNAPLTCGPLAPVEVEQMVRRQLLIEWLMSPEPTPTTREALLLRPELCGESHPGRGASTWSLPQSDSAVVIARVSTAFTLRKSSRYFLLEHSRKVFVRPQFTRHYPLSSGPAATSKLLSKRPPFPGDQKHHLRTHVCRW